MMNRKKIILSIAILFLLMSGLWFYHYVIYLIDGLDDDPLAYDIFEVLKIDDRGSIELIHEGIAYRSFFSIADSSLRGKRIGTARDDPDLKIYEVKGYDRSEWIVVYFDHFMGGGGDIVWKSVDVTDIPEELREYQRRNTHDLVE